MDTPSAQPVTWKYEVPFLTFFVEHSARAGVKNKLHLWQSYGEDHPHDYEHSWELMMTTPGPPKNYTWKIARSHRQEPSSGAMRLQSQRGNTTSFEVAGRWFQMLSNMLLHVQPTEFACGTWPAMCLGDGVTRIRLVLCTHKRYVPRIHHESWNPIWLIKTIAYNASLLTINLSLNMIIYRIEAIWWFINDDQGQVNDH